MKIKIFALVSLLCFSIGFAVNAAGDDHTPDQNKAAKEFAFEGISLGATYSEIKAKYPDIEFLKDKSDAKVGLAVWTTFSSKAADSVDFYLFSGKLYKVRVFYFSKTLSKFGGYEAVYEKLVAKYGKEDETSDGEDYVCDYTWQFFDSNRYINFYVSKKNYTGLLIVADKEAGRQLTEKQKSKADVGF
jgi:hypothetical protein